MVASARSRLAFPAPVSFSTRGKTAILAVEGEASHLREEGPEVAHEEGDLGAAGVVGAVGAVEAVDEAVEVADATGTVTAAN